jgi:hypothetical protein
MITIALKKAEQKNSWLSKFIGWRTYSPYSHVEVLVGDYACSSVFPDGVRIAPVNKVITNKHEWDFIPLPFVAEEPVLEWFKAHKGSPYDTRSLVEILAGKESSDPSAFNCAESVMSAIQAAGYLGWFDSKRAHPEAVALAARGLLEGYHCWS